MGKKQLKSIITEQSAELETVKEELAASKTTEAMWYKNYQEQQAIVNEMHSMFDAIEGCQPRSVKVEDSWGGCSTVNLTLQARFASYLQTLIK